MSLSVFPCHIHLLQRQAHAEDSQLDLFDILSSGIDHFMEHGSILCCKSWFDFFLIFLYLWIVCGTVFFSSTIIPFFFHYYVLLHSISGLFHSGWCWFIFELKIPAFRISQNVFNIILRLCLLWRKKMLITNSIIISYNKYFDKCHSMIYTIDTNYMFETNHSSYTNKSRN